MASRRLRPMTSTCAQFLRRSIGATALVAALTGGAAAVTPAAARVWIGFGFPFYFGAPAYYYPPPAYYAPAPGYYAGPPIYSWSRRHKHEEEDD